jgi:hypothetical protein
MERCYDIFEVLPHDELLWKAAVEGRDAAVQKLHQLADHSAHEFRLIYLPTNTVIFTINPPLSDSHGS